LFLLFSLILAINFSNSAELQIISADFDPYTYETPNGGSGVMYEIVQEMARRVGQSPKIEFQPWARAQSEAQSRPNIGILPLARVPERESKYAWIVLILEDPYVFFAKKNSKVDISTIEAAKPLRIGTFGGSLAEVLLRKIGFKNFASVTTDVQNVKMLKIDRIDAWVAPLSFKNRYKKKGGLGEKDLRVGATVTILREYFAASKSIDQETIRKWQKAFASMKKDGSYNKIMKKYGFTPLK
jgi:polar amino acid transport system substrate-binding protein